MKSAYDLNNLIKDCIVGTLKASVTKGAMETARTDFNLKTQEAVMRFIGNGGLESPSLNNSKPWKNNPNPSNQVMVDSYDFYSGAAFGYVAFFRGPQKWIIKSFKKNIKLDMRNLVFKKTLSKLKN